MLTIEDFRPIESPFRNKPGTLVKVRPCAEKYGNKTFLGILVGDAPIGFFYDKDNKKMIPHRNPMILIPDTHSVVFGVESWWGEIDSLDDLDQITNEDISDIWYVKLLKEIGRKESKVSNEK